MENRFLRTLKRVDGTTNKFRATRRKNLDPNVFRYGTWCFNESPHEIIIGVARTWEGDFDFFVALVWNS